MKRGIELSDWEILAIQTALENYLPYMEEFSGNRLISKIKGCCKIKVYGHDL